jgi:hypothetical protein
MSLTSQTPGNAQVELLKLFSSDLSGIELAELKKILLACKIQRVAQWAEKNRDEKGWTEETMKQFLGGNMPIPYNYPGHTKS